MKSFTVLLFASASVCFAQGPDARITQGINFGGQTAVGKVTAPVLNEISGVIASWNNENVLWVNNDSGDQPQVYALSTSGELLCTAKITNATNIDFEAISIGRGPDPKASYIYAADIGDNAAKRTSICIYRFAEPKVGSTMQVVSVTAEKFEFTYPDGARDAEAIIVDPLTQELYFVTKREKKGRVYRASSPLIPSSKSPLTFVCELPFTLVTDGCVSTKGNEILLKNYVFVYHFTRSGSEPLSATFKRDPIRVPYMPEPQGEAICFSANGNGYFTLSERADTTIDYPVNFYPRQKGQAQTLNVKETEQQTIHIEPSPDTPGIYLLRYNVPVYSPIRINVLNEAMMEIETVEATTSEQGVQEREIDMIDKTSGTYVVVLRAGRAYSAVPIEFKRR